MVSVSDVADTVKTFTVGKRRFPEIVALLVTTSELTVAVPVTPALLLTVRELRVVTAPNEALLVTTSELRVVNPVDPLNVSAALPPTDPELLKRIWVLVVELVEDGSVLDVTAPVVGLYERTLPA